MRLSRKLLIGLAALAQLVALRPAEAASPCDPLDVPLAASIADGARIGFADPTATATCDLPGPALLSAIRQTLARGGVVLLGEVHDNGQHHTLRSRWLQHSVRGIRAPGLVFEHLRQDQQAEIDAINRTPSTSAAAFQALRWSDSGWPDAALFEPLMTEALALLPSGGALSAGDPPRGQVRDVAKRGLTALPPELIGALRLQDPISPPLLDSLLTELEASHCGLMPKTAFVNMAAAQRFRDATLARAALTARAAHGSAIVFAGNGHVRRDRGIPEALRRMAPDVPVLVVQILEHSAELDVTVRDVTVVTVAAQRDDPCLEMRARWSQKK
jgi:uncharacterized iron-regulated protein